MLCRKNSSRHRETVRQYCARIKLKLGCARCGYRENAVALEFNHIDPKTKSFPLGNAPSIKAADEEMKKCVVLCSNCHSIHHYEMRHAKSS